MMVTTRQQEYDRARYLAWRQNCPEEYEKHKVKMRELYYKKREEKKKKVYEYQRKNILKVRYWKMKHKCKVLYGVKTLFTFEEWQKKLNETNGICPNCKSQIGIMELTLDHIIPKSSGVKTEYKIEDVQPLCLDCNWKKGDFWINEGREYGSEKQVH